MSKLSSGLSLLQEVLEVKFALEVSVIPLSTAVFQISVVKHDLIIIFYSNLSAHVVHHELSFSGRTIHLDEDLLLHKRSIVISRLAAALQRSDRVYARNTQIRRINKEEAIAFQQIHHLQIYLPGKYRFGLFHEGALVAVAVFSGGRKMNNKSANYRSYELLRFCQRTNLVVIGGLSKLIKGMVRQFEPGDIMTYVDKDWSDGKIYRQLGFIRIAATLPQRFYIHRHVGLRYDMKAYQGQFVGNPGGRAEELYTTENLGSIKMLYIV